MQLLGPVQTEPRDPAGGYMARVASPPANSWFLVPPEYQLTALETKPHMRYQMEGKTEKSMVVSKTGYQCLRFLLSIQDLKSFMLFGRFRISLTVCSWKRPGPRTQPLPPRSLQCGGQGWRKVSHDGQVRSQGGRGGSNQERLCETLCWAHPSCTYFHLSSQRSFCGSDPDSPVGHRSYPRHTNTKEMSEFTKKNIL